MRFFSLVSFLFTISLGSVAQAQTSAFIAEKGLAKAEQQLSALPDKSADDQFALGALRFLRGIEITLQTRWQSNATISDLNLPVLRLPVPPNPKPTPFSPALITGLFSDLLTDMQSVRQALTQIPTDADVSLELNLSDLWFDVNSNGAREPGEGVVELGSGILTTAPGLDNSAALPGDLPVRFDSADVAWLMAYTHLLSGISELVVAFDPTEAIATVLDTNKELSALLGTSMPESAMDLQFGHWVDQIAMVYGALNQQPDAAHTRKAHGHFLNMIAQNRLFWSGLDTETDDLNEWIPNANQTAALGFELPPETGAVWQDILTDAEALLNGDLLVPYWRISPAGGVNIKNLFMDPPVVDVVTWIQGSGLLPYLERGPVVSNQNLRRFEGMVSGNALMFSILFN